MPRTNRPLPESAVTSAILLPEPDPWYRRRYARLPGWAWAGLALLLVAGGLLPKRPRPTPAAPVKPARPESPVPELPAWREPDLAVAADELSAAFASGAGSPYVGKLLLVRGRVFVARVSTWGPSKGTFYLLFTYPDEVVRGRTRPSSWTVQADFLHPSHAPELAEGQAVAVLGRCRGAGGTRVVLEACRVAP